MNNYTNAYFYFNALLLYKSNGIKWIGRQYFEENFITLNALAYHPFGKINYRSKRTSSQDPSWQCLHSKKEPTDLKQSKLPRLIYSQTKRGIGGSLDLQNKLFRTLLHHADGTSRFMIIKKYYEYRIIIEELDAAAQFKFLQ